MSETTLQPATEKDLAVLGWKMQRRQHERERAEQAQRAEAIATGRKIRGGTWTIVLPPEYSVNPETADDAIRYIETASGALCEIVDVALSREVVTDPRGVWQAARLVTTCNRIARQTASRMRGATDDDAQDAASQVVADILKRTHGGMPLKADIPETHLPFMLKEQLGLALGKRQAETPDSDADGATTDPSMLAEQANDAELRRAQRDADAMLRHWADPLSREAAAAAESLGLSQAETDALIIDGYGLRPADVSAHTGRTPSTIRVSLSRGRASIAKRNPDAIRAAFRDARRNLSYWQARDERAARLSADALRFLSGDAERPARKIAAYPDRMPARDADDETDAHTVAHAAVTIRVGRTDDDATD